MRDPFAQAVDHRYDLERVAVGDTLEEAETEIRSAIAFYLDELRRRGEPVPEPTNLVGTVKV